MTTTTTKIAYNSAATSIPMTLTGLLSSTTVGNQSAPIDNTSNLYDDVQISAAFLTSNTASMTLPAQVFVYISASFDGSTYTQDANAIGATNTGYILDATTNLKLAAVVNASTAGKTYISGCGSLASLFGGIMPQKWVICVVNNTGQPLSTASGSTLSYTGITFTTA